MTARSKRWLAVGAAGAMALTGTLAASTTVATAGGAASQGQAKHVLLISVDGLHQFDLQQFVNLHPDSTLAHLVEAGTDYTNASTSRPSDSFPGLLAPVTGGTPKSTGVLYDDTWARDLFPDSTCTAPSGTEAQYAENIDLGVANNTRPIMNATIDQTQLPFQKVNGNCLPLFPNDFLRTNTIFAVAHQAGLPTAWSDKHPAYQIVNGHGTPHSVDDLFTPEINADLVPNQLVDTRNNNAIKFPFPNPDGTGKYFITDYVGNTEAYDQIKVDAILNEIDGKKSTGEAAKVPAIFGMNFQSVSVGQKDVDPSLTCDPNRFANNVGPCDPNYFPGGYVPSQDGLRFTPQMDGLTAYANGIKVLGALDYVDNALGSMVNELKAKGLYSSTQIIIEAKHGQSPIDPNKLDKIGGAEGDVLSHANINVNLITDDDIALIWLKDQSQTTAAVNALQASIANGNPARIQTIFHGAQLAGLFNDPLTDPHTPDIIIQPIPGTIYSGSHKKVAEHGGFAPDDTHIALLVVNGGAQPGNTIDSPVQTTQIAPTILKTLGLNPGALDAVQMEGTRSLSGLGQ